MACHINYSLIFFFYGGGGGKKRDRDRPLLPPVGYNPRQIVWEGGLLPSPLLGSDPPGRWRPLRMPSTMGNYLETRLERGNSAGWAMPHSSLSGNPAKVFESLEETASKLQIVLFNIWFEVVKRIGWLPMGSGMIDRKSRYDYGHPQ